MSKHVTAKMALLAMGFSALLPVAAPAAEADPGLKRVCRVQVPTGSRLPKRVCKTKAEWDLAEQRTRDGVQNAQMDGTARGGVMSDRGPQ